MRIAIDARELLGRPTGVGRYLAELLARWTRDPTARDAELRLISPRPLDSARPWAGEGGARLVVDHVPGRPGTWWEQTALPAAARRAGASVLFAPAYEGPLFARAPLVVSVHDVSFFAHPEWFSPREGLRRRALTRASARRARAVLTLTEFSRREIVRHLGVDARKVRVIPPAVDAHAAFGAGTGGAQAGAERREPLVLYAGSLFNRRHVPDLIAGFATLASERADVRLALVGDNRTRPPVDVEAVARGHGVAGRVSWRAYVPDDELASLYRRASVFAFLSEYEGFGLTPLEALSAGVPGVLLDTEVAREAYGGAALFVRIDDGPAALGNALRALLDAGETREAILAEGVKVLARYSWDRAARDTWRALAEAAD
jgi:glycosyltransferase involved in cell wall biosynthesis